MVFLRGQVAQDLDSRESLHVGDAGKQTEKTMQNIAMLLEEAGSCMDHVCRIVVYLTDIRYREAVYQEMGKWLKGVHPCSTGIVVPALARPEWVVEIGGDGGHPRLAASAQALMPERVWTGAMPDSEKQTGELWPNDADATALDI